MTTMTTDRGTYQTGQTVNAAAHWTNDGPTCQWPKNPTYFTYPCASGYVNDSQGQPVWQVGATPQGEVMAGTCALYSVPSPTPHGYSVTFPLTWNQLRCADPPPTWNRQGDNPNCPETQVPAGTYAVNLDSRTTPVEFDITA